jgi:hypothetical protein
MEDAFAVDNRDGAGVCNGCKSNGNGGYCVLSCNKFNTPLFCDKDHPQDIFEENGGRSTYNHLVNAILHNPRAKVMYFSRLRTLVDKYLHGGE